MKSIKANHEGMKNLGMQIKPVITDLKEDYHKLGDSVYGVDRQGTYCFRDIVEDIIGDILPTKFIMSSLTASPMAEMVKMMGMETMFVSMFDYPD